MRRSKYGYLLLALLVITGLAGTITSTTISGKERKFAANALKETKSDLLVAVKDLSRKQLEFRTVRGTLSIKDYVYHIAGAEKSYWSIVQAGLRQPTNPERRADIHLTDEQLVETVQQEPSNRKEEHAAKAGFRTVDDALETFKTNRANHLKYIKSTTEDLRNHIVLTPLGWLDCYQVCLLIAAQTGRYVQRIEEIKANPKFPSR